jgi:hypothetical protein
MNTTIAMLRSTLVAGGLLIGFTVQPAFAQTVPFDGTVVASCVLTTTAGRLAMNSTGTTLGSEQSGGTAGILGVTATGTFPTVQFTAPTLANKPVGYAGSPTVQLKYTSPGGANQAYSSVGTQYTSNRFSDTVTLHIEATDNNGFAAGTYRLQTTATCQQ